MRTALYSGQCDPSSGDNANQRGDSSVAGMAADLSPRMCNNAMHDGRGGEQLSAHCGAPYLRPAAILPISFH